MIRILLAFVLLFPTLPTQALADRYPSKPIKDFEPIARLGRLAFVREQLDAWGKLIRAAKIQPE